MQLTSYTSAGEFLAAAGDILRSDEARYGLIYGIAGTVAENPHHYGVETPWFCTIDDDSGINAMAWRTPPYQPGLLHISGDPGTAASLLLDAIRTRWPVIPGAMGDREIIEPFVREWCRLQGVTVLQRMQQRLYRLDKITDIDPAPGDIRRATMDDRPLVEKWMHGFMVDCFGLSASSRPQQDMRSILEKGNLFLWEDNGISVSMCGKTRPTYTGMTIGLVYTPPEQRGRGYATSCVAAVCREILTSGKTFCTLYADLANPYSNAAYVNVGFYPVCDSLDCTFSVPD